MDFDLVLRVCSVLPIESENFSVHVSADGFGLDVHDASRSFKVTPDSLDDIVNLSKHELWYKMASVHTTDLVCVLLTAYMNDGTAEDLQVIGVNKLSKVVAFRIDGGMGEYVLDLNTGYCYTIGTNPYDLEVVYNVWAQKQYLVNLVMQNMLIIPLLKDIPVGFDGQITVNDYLAIRKDSWSAWKKYPANHLGLFCLALDYEKEYRIALSQTNVFHTFVGPALEYIKELEVTIPKLNAQGNNNCSVERENGYVLTTLRNGNKVIRIAHHGDFAVTYNCNDLTTLKSLVEAAINLLNVPTQESEESVVQRYMDFAAITDPITEILRILRVMRHQNAIDDILKFIQEVS